MDNFDDIKKAIDDIDTRYFTMLEWQDNLHTNVSAWMTKKGWEVFCWSSRRIPGIDFDDVVMFPFEEFKTDTSESKKFAMMLYDITVSRVASMGARVVHSC
jgi:hypothetical protein